MYYEGRGVPKDEQHAYFWFLLSSARGNESSAKARDFVEGKLTAKQRVDAQVEARSWKPKTPTDIGSRR